MARAKAISAIAGLPCAIAGVAGHRGEPRLIRRCARRDLVGGEVERALRSFEIVEPDQRQSKAMRRLRQFELVGGRFAPKLRHVARRLGIVGRQRHAFGQFPARGRAWAGRSGRLVAQGRSRSSSGMPGRRPGRDWGRPASEAGRVRRRSCGTFRKRVHRAQQQGYVLLARQAVIAVLYQRDLYIVRTQALCEPHADLPRHVGVALPVDQPHGGIDRNRSAEQQLRLPVAKKPGAWVSVQGRRIVVIHGFACQQPGLVGFVASPVGEVGGGGRCRSRRPAGCPRAMPTVSISQPPMDEPMTITGPSTTVSDQRQHLVAPTRERALGELPSLCPQPE